jgi:predicted phosphodiesterase
VGVRRRLALQKVLAATLLVLLLASPVLAGRWTFAAIGDNRSFYASYRNVLQQIKTMSVNVRPKFPPIDFVLAVGDLDPVAKNDKIYKEFFKTSAPVYVPVRGNHEKPDDVDYILQNILPGIGNRLHLRNQESVQYYLDWNNTRVIVLDQYADWPNALTNPEALKWLENAITSATHADHVFISFHEPKVPREVQGNPFWELLSRHHDKVRAVFVGHTHVYERRKIGKEEAGIDLINVGNAGQSKHSDNQQTIVEVMVDDSVVYYRAIQALDGTEEFRLTAEWESSAPKKVPAAGSTRPETVAPPGQSD